MPASLGTKHVGSPWASAHGSPERRSCRSHLHQMMTAGFGQQLLTASRIAETIGAAQLDGLAISEYDADVLLMASGMPARSGSFPARSAAWQPVCSR